MKRDWKKFWNSIDTCGGKDNGWSEMMVQVGKTVQCEPISEIQFKKTHQRIVAALSLNMTDNVLDLCCGNGAITTRIAPHANSVIGVDFSQPLIDVANGNKPANVQYILASVLDRFLIRKLSHRQFEKVYMNESLQNFSDTELETILDGFLSISKDQALFYIAGIPEKSKRSAFYDTDKKRTEYYKRVANGTEIMGTWWEREYLETVAKSKGLTFKTMDQAPDFYTHNYRFDAILGKNVAIE